MLPLAFKGTILLKFAILSSISTSEVVHEQEENYPQHRL